MNMSRFSKFLYVAAAAAIAAACTPAARIDGVIGSAPSSEVIVKLLEVNRYEVLDTVKTDASGHFSYKVNVEEGQPEFIYLFHNDRRIASLLLETGDKVSISADTLGNYTVEGSAESAGLAQVEKEYSAAQARLQAIALQLETAEGSQAEALS